jgi:hypothetical protein
MPLDCLGKPSGTVVYPSLWTRRFPRDDRDGDEQAAFAMAEWLQHADRSGSLGGFLKVASLGPITWFWRNLRLSFCKNARKTVRKPLSHS